jgi:hypothetical protein
MSELFQKGFSQKKRHDARKLFSDITYTAHDIVSWEFFGPKNVDLVQKSIQDYVHDLAKKNGKDYKIDRQSDREVAKIMVATFVDYYMQPNIPSINRSGLQGSCSKINVGLPQAFLFSDKMDSYDPETCKQFKNDGTLQEEYQWKIPVEKEKCTLAGTKEYYQTKHSQKIAKINDYVQTGCVDFWQQKQTMAKQISYLNSIVIEFIARGVYREVENYLMFIHDTNLPYRLMDQPIYSSTNNKKSIELEKYYSGNDTRPKIRTCSTNRVLPDAVQQEFQKQGIDYLELNKLRNNKEFKAFDFKKQWGCPTSY